MLLIGEKTVNSSKKKYVLGFCEMLLYVLLVLSEPNLSFLCSLQVIQQCVLLHSHIQVELVSADSINFLNLAVGVSIREIPLLLDDAVFILQQPGTFLLHGFWQ